MGVQFISEAVSVFRVLIIENMSLLELEADVRNTCNYEVTDTAKIPADNYAVNEEEFLTGNLFHISRYHMC